MSIFSKQSLKPWLIPSGLILLNFILKIIFLGRRDIAMDEPFTIFYAQAGFPALFEMLKTENNPPLFFVLLHFWIKVFGISALSVRFLPFLFSTLTAPLIYLTGKRYFSAHTGILASLIFTFSNYHLAFSHEARVYPLFALLTCLSMYFFFAMTQNPERKPTIYLLILTNVLLIYSHFFGFFVIGIQIFSSLISQGRKSVRICLLAQAAVLFFYLPYFPVLFSRFFASSHGTWVPQPVISDLYTMVWRFSNVPVVTVFFLMIMMVALVKYFMNWRNHSVFLSPFQKILLLWFFFPYLLIFLLSFWIPMFLDRYLIFVSIAFYFLVAQAIIYTWQSRKIIFYALSLLAVGGMLLTFTPNIDNHRQLKKVIEVIRGLKQKETPVLICPEWLDLGFTYYYNSGYFKDTGNLRQNLQKESIFPVNQLHQIPPVILELSTSVILLEEWPEVVDKKNEILTKLSNTFRSCTEIKIPEAYRVYYFSGRR